MSPGYWIKIHLCNSKCKNYAIKFVIFTKFYIDILKCPTMFVIQDRWNVIGAFFFFPRKGKQQEGEKVLFIYRQWQFLIIDASLSKVLLTAKWAIALTKWGHVAYLISFTYMSMILCNSRRLISLSFGKNVLLKGTALLNAILFSSQLSFVSSMQMQKRWALILSPIYHHHN